MFASITDAEAFCGEVFPAGIDARWEKEYRTIWNERERASEERELVYETATDFSFRTPDAVRER